MSHRRCRLFQFLFLLLWSVVGQAVSSPNAETLEESELQWRTANHELIIGMPMMGSPPYSYKDAVQGFNGPVPEMALLIARALGVPLHYKEFTSYDEALSALQAGEVHIVINFPPGEQWENQIASVPLPFFIPQGVLLNRPLAGLSLDEARNIKWVCMVGTDSCGQLEALGLVPVKAVERRSEATFMLKQRLADAYLADMPSLMSEHVQNPNAGFAIVQPEWAPVSSLSVNMLRSNPGLIRLVNNIMPELPVTDMRPIIEAITGVNASASGEITTVKFTPEEQAWLRTHPVLRYGVSPNWVSMSEFNYRGRLVGYVPDIVALLRRYSGLEFSLVRTDSWRETQELLKKHQIDFIPVMTPSAEREHLGVYTPNYMFVDRVIVGGRHSKNLSDLGLLRGMRVGIVDASIDEELLASLGALPVEVKDDSRLLRLLDEGRADYILLTMTTLPTTLGRGFEDRYRVVYSGQNLRLPGAMGVSPADLMLQQILTKILYAIPQHEIDKLESRWLTMRLQTGLETRTVVLWFLVCAGGALVFFTIFWHWNQTLQRQNDQRKEAQKQLNEQLAFVQTLLDSLPSMVALRDRQQNLTLCNRAYREAFIGAESGGDGWSYMQLSEREQMLREELSVWETGTMYEGAGFTRRIDDSQFHVVYVKLPYRGPDGEIQGVLTVLTDVSALKAAENKVREVEAMLRDMTDSMPGVVYQYQWHRSEQGRFLYVSQGAGETLGVPSRALMSARSEWKGFGVSEEVLQEFTYRVADNALTLTPIDWEVKVPHHGGERYLQVRGTFVEQGEDTLLLNGMVQDITALKLQEKALREARANAEQAMRARSRFLATMSHELRTPISGMHGMLELLRMSNVDDDQRYLLRNVVTSTNNLLYLVNDILDFSKIEAGQLHIDNHMSHLQSVICDAIRGHATQAHGKGLHVDLCWAGHVPDRADIDAVRVAQVVSNLLNNAVKFTERGVIAINVHYHNQQLVVTVTDSGIGIAEEKQALLFTPFEQLESDINRRFGGTGLGLAICDQLIRKMGGSLTLKSRAGEGASFCFTIPITNPRWDTPVLADSEWWYFGDDPQLHAMMQRFGATLQPVDAERLGSGISGLLLADEDQLERALGSDWLARIQKPDLKGIIFSSREVLRSRLGPERWWRLGQSPLYPDLLLESCRELLGGSVHTIMVESEQKLSGRVLVADDHPVNRALLVRQLTLLGVDCEVVEDGEKALKAWQEQRFSLLLTDCHMPVMDGFTLTQQLRAQGERAPIIGVTADTSKEASARMVAAGMNGMLLKPYLLEALRQILLQWLPASQLAEPQPLPERADSELAERWIALFSDEATGRAMAGEYLASNQQDGVEMSAALATRDADALLEVAHRIKGAARIVGEDELAEQAERLESAARLEQWGALEGWAQRVDELMTQVTHKTRLWLDA
ncbi:ATP-binding protein [Aeromonas sp. EERV15]|uniref:ATP-binding protein n=1 Tax=Aeromonas sp. EERV15 TaxID=1833892 RepID=UPI00083B3D4B|nr:transporter substrate-binding domain-containing protein [Aeromonas sp. EERV15]